MDLDAWIVLVFVSAAVARLLVAIIDCFCGFFDRESE